MLILASDGNIEYLQFQSLWRQYTKSNPHIDCFFYKGNPNLDEPANLVDDTIYVKIEDTLDTVYEKLMMTLRFLSPDFHKYNFLYRTNLSSFVDFEKYIEFCKTLPETNCCAAVIGNHGGILFPSGSGFTLSIDLAKRFVDETPPAVYLDDVSVGSALTKWGVQYIRTNRADYNEDGMWYRLVDNETIFHYRAKTNNRQNDYNAISHQIRLRLVYPHVKCPFDLLKLFTWENL